MQGAIYAATGSGQLAGYGVSIRARRLDEAAVEGLPVPASYVLLDSLWVASVNSGAVDVKDDGTVVCDDPAALYEALTLPGFPAKTTVMLRSAFSTEETPSGALGASATVADVDPTDAAAFVGALCEVWSAAGDADDLRRDVLVMQTVDAEYAGTAITQTNYEDDQVTYVEGGVADLTGDEVERQTAQLRRLRQFEKAPNEEGVTRIDATWEDRVQALMRRVRGLFGGQNWTVEWADDGDRAWLLAVRPLTDVVERNERFTRGNFKEILPPMPSRYMTSIIEKTGDDLYAWYRQFDEDLPRHRPFVEVFAGRPYVNLSLMSETMRRLGLPTTLAAQTSDAGGDGFNLKRAVAKLPSLAQFGLSQLGAVDSAKAAAADIRERAATPGDSFGAVTETLQAVYVRMMTETFNLAQTLVLPLQTLRRRGYMDALAAGSRNASTAIFDDLAALREYVEAHPDVKQALENGETPDDPEFRRRWGLYLTKHGHRGIYEVDIARPRYRNESAALVRALLSDGPGVRRREVDTNAIEDIPRLPWVQAKPAAKQAKALIEAREQLRSEAMMAFEMLRKRLLELADKAVERGQLPERDAIWQMTVDELAMLDVDWQPGDDFFEARAEEIEAEAAQALPDTLWRNDDLDDYAPDADTDAEQFSGLSLVAGEVTGQAWVLDEPADTLPEGFTPENTILVVRSVDSGWAPVFAQVAGVVVETGGDLSSGSAVLRELGVPSVTNVANATRVFGNGDAVRLDGGRGTVHKE